MIGLPCMGNRIFQIDDESPHEEQAGGVPDEVSVVEEEAQGVEEAVALEVVDWEAEV